MPDSTVHSPMPSPPGPPPGRFAHARLIAREWWVFVLRGVLALLFAVLAFVMPRFGLTLILSALAAWLLIDGATTLYQAIGGPKERGRAGLWIDGLLSVVAATALLLLPAVSAVALVVVIGIWAVVAGVARVAMAVRTRSLLLGFYGAVTVLLGIWLLAAPGPGLLALIWLVGLQAATAGFLLVGLGWQLRRVHHDPHGPATDLA